MENKIENKYIPLANYFEASKEGTLKLSFAEIETIIGQKLPNAAYLNKSWWTKTKPPLQHFLSWTNNGYFVSKVLPSYYVQFEKPQFQIEQSEFADQKTCTYIIRPAELDDARNLVKLSQRVNIEKEATPPYFLHTAETAPMLRKRISTWHAKNTGQIFVAIVEGNIQGAVEINKVSANYAQHRAEVKLTIAQDFIPLNIDLLLLESAKRWASLNNIHRIELSISVCDTALIERFEQFGFLNEGVKKDAIFYNNEYFDELFMGIIL